MENEFSSLRIKDMMARLDAEIVAARDLHELYTGLCDLVVGVGAYCMAMICLAENDDDLTVRPVAYAGFNSRYIETIKLSWSNLPNGSGPTGAAIRTGEVHVVNDVSTDPRMRNWREMALGRGYRSCISLPLSDRVETFGVIVVVAREVERFDAEAVAALTLLAQKVSTAVIRLRKIAHLQLVAIR